MKKRLIKCLCISIVFTLFTSVGTISSLATGNDGQTESEASSSESDSNDKDDKSESSKDDGSDNKKDSDKDSDGKKEQKVDTAALQDSIKRRQDELNNLSKEKKQLEQDRSNIQQVINSLEYSKQEASTYIAKMDAEVEAIQKNIDDLNDQIDTKRAEIEITKQELLDAEQTVEEQYNAMKARIRFMYETGDSLYLELLFSADTYGDMLNKADYINQLSAYDRRMLEEYRVVVEYTQSVKDTLEAEEEVLQAAIESAETEEQNLNTLIKEKENQIAEYENEIQDKEAAIAEYDQELAERAEVMRAIENAIAQEKQQLADANRIRYDGGMFTFPAPQYVKVSSDFGNRLHPTLGVNKFHDGIDLAAPGGSPILAAYDGKVASTGYTAGMGNYVIINHGDGLYTIYMHASAIYVSQGKAVSAGEKIAAVGTTGRSTGNHLHFGVRLNGQYVSPWNYLK